MRARFGGTFLVGVGCWVQSDPASRVSETGLRCEVGSTCVHTCHWLEAGGLGWAPHLQFCLLPEAWAFKGLFLLG